MTEAQIDALKAFLRYGATLATKLEWRQRVLMAIAGKRDEHQARSRAADAAGDSQKAHEHDVHDATLRGFLAEARMGAKWHAWLYLVEPSSDETAWLAYVAECEAENLNAHDIHMWEVHKRPTSPV